MGFRSHGGTHPAIRLGFSTIQLLGHLHLWKPPKDQLRLLGNCEISEILRVADHVEEVEGSLKRMTEQKDLAAEVRG